MFLSRYIIFKRFSRSLSQDFTWTPCNFSPTISYTEFRSFSEKYSNKKNSGKSSREILRGTSRIPRQIEDPCTKSWKQLRGKACKSPEWNRRKGSMQISSNGCCRNPERNFGRKLTEKITWDKVQDKSLYTMRDITGNNVGDRSPGSNFDRNLRTDRNHSWTFNKYPGRR